MRSLRKEPFFINKKFFNDSRKFFLQNFSSKFVTISPLFPIKPKKNSHHFNSLLLFTDRRNRTEIYVYIKKSTPKSYKSIKRNVFRSGYLDTADKSQEQCVM